MTNKDLEQKRFVLLNESTTIEIGLEHVRRINELLIDFTDKDCDILAEGALYDNAFELVRMRPYMNCLIALMFEKTIEIENSYEHLLRTVFDILKIVDSEQIEKIEYITKEGIK